MLRKIFASVTAVALLRSGMSLTLNLGLITEQCLWGCSGRNYSEIFNTLSTNGKGNCTPRIKYIPRLNLPGELVSTTQPTGRVSSIPISKAEECVH